MTANEWAENKVAELAEQIKELVTLGWDTEEAIDYTRSNSILGNKYFMMVVEKVYSK